MATSILIAKLMGPILLVAALAMLAKPKDLQEMVRGFLDDRPLIYLTGVLTMLAGLAIVNSHNVWTASWPVIITIFGWAAVVGGVFRIALPATVQSVGRAMIERQTLLRVSSVVWLLFGAWLTYVGYFTPPILG